MLLETIRGASHVEPEGGAAFGQRAATWNASALAIWDDPSRDDEHIAWARAAADRMASGSLTGAGYANYAPVDESIERVRLAFGTERFARLAAVKARYDPDNRFRFNQNIAPG
jgi:FAD/FMN-containing dehydrogenase